MEKDDWNFWSCRKTKHESIVNVAMDIKIKSRFNKCMGIFSWSMASKCFSAYKDKNVHG